MKKNTDVAEWADMLQQAAKSKIVEPKGPGWATARQLREVLGVGRSKLDDILLKGKREGSIESFSGTTLNPEGKIVQMVWYRRVKK